MPTVSIILDDSSSKSFTLDEGEILYEGLARQGLELPHGCLAGSCSVCKIIVVKGAENLDHPGVIESNTLKSTYEDNPDARDKCLRLSCRARVLGSVEVMPFPKSEVT
ncbi:MAG: 2Fe-2S iron-sulfur cluster-binding protein [Bacteriovoracales bacterium]|nr:2Fe-2S iron-sulfur cluster-binding protein [Bacteriovoracales bacterium]